MIWQSYIIKEVIRKEVMKVIVVEKDGTMSGDLGALEELKAFDISDKIKLNKKA